MVRDLSLAHHKSVQISKSMVPHLGEKRRKKGLMRYERGLRRRMAQ